MELRSGKVYDPTFPSRAREFMHMCNPRFSKLWIDSMHIYVESYRQDSLNVKKAQRAFYNHMMVQVKEAIGYFP